MDALKLLDAAPFAPETVEILKQALEEALGQSCSNRRGGQR